MCLFTRFHSVRSFLPLFACASAWLIPASESSACDVCGCYTPNQEINFDPLRPRVGGFYVATAEQYTFFGTTKFSGREVPNVADQYEQSSLTQLIAGYNFNDRLGVQVNAPLIERDFKRPEGFATDRGRVGGLGDMSLLFNFVAFHKETNLFHPPTPLATKSDAKDSPGGHQEDGAGRSDETLSSGKDFSFSLNLIAGAKFPTGSAGRIKEEFHEVEVEGATPSGIHGHDLALGSGSYDTVLGAGVFTRYKRAFFQANGQYTVRTTGAYDYRYANDVSFDAGPGVFLLRGQRFGGWQPLTFGAQFVVSGEHKNRDTFRGEIAEDTGATAVYVGPRLLAGVGQRVIGEVGADLPVRIDNTAFQVVPSYRIRGGFSVKF